MRKIFLTLPALFLFLAIAPQAWAGLPSDTCFPAVECNSGYDYYADDCEPHIVSTNSTTPSCQSVYGAPASGKQWAFTCENGCYQSTIPVPATCPGGVTVSGYCLAELNVVDDNVPVSGEEAYKIWDGSNLTEIVHVGTGCADGEVPIADNDGSSGTGWTCGVPGSPSLWAENGSNIYYNSGNVGIGTTSPAYTLDVLGTGSSFAIRARSDGYGISGADTESGTTGYLGFSIYGVYGSGTSIGYGVYGSGGIAGVRGQAIGTTAAGVSGGGTNYGVFGSGTNYGVYGVATTTGVYGEGDTWGVYSQGRGYFSDNVGIGTTSPGAGLHIKRDGWPSSFIWLDTNASGQDAGIRLYENGTVRYHIYNSSSTDTLHIDPNGAIGIAVSSSGNVGIGTTSPSSKLQIQGSGTQGVYIGAGFQTALEVQYASQAGIVGKGGTYGIYGSSDGGIGVLGDTYNGTGFKAYARSTSAVAGLDAEGGWDKGIYIHARSIFWPDIGIDSNAWIEAGRFTNGYRSSNNAIIAGQYYGIDAQGYTAGGYFRDGDGGTGQIKLANGNYSLYADEGNAYFEDSVGIGTTSPGYKLDVNGTFRARGTTYIGSSNTWYFNTRTDNGDMEIVPSVGGWDKRLWFGASTGNIYAQAFTPLSDARLKDIQGGYTKGLEVVQQLKPTTFIWKSDAEKGENAPVQVGLIAQEVQKVLPEAVSTADDPDHTLAINNTVLTAALINSIKELKAEKDAEIAALKEALCEIKPEAELCQQ